ncbi:flagellar type III secretion system pore protein FliP [Kineosporia mesophila]|uniref:Flagellar biosynthetic protein FliP n=1 Tax=Kineosporia mesophila TaxID=566012 RepID=A0ABP6ZHC6_9ACTN|nr:flagellar type III secretion system pore protein FliP [Kineosporia mesophila]MCD5350653.1 flagellar type III secretion system pore protein FliP [Kineosporia mesophila]
MTGHSSRKGLRPGLRLFAGLLFGLAFCFLQIAGPGPAAQAAVSSQSSTPVSASISAPVEPNNPADPDNPTAADSSDVTVSVPGQRSQVISIILLVTLIGVAPSVLLLCTSFTKLVVVLSLTRQALGTPSVPPNQVLVGLALFLSLFIMGPTADAINEKAIQPYSKGDMTVTQAYRAGSQPLREFMLKHTRDEELALMTRAADLPNPATREKVDLRTLIPAFVLSELRGAFIIGFVIFIPFLVIDIVVSAILMSLGMVMLPPALVSLPFKLLLFVLVDGWSLIVTTLIGSYR